MGIGLYIHVPFCRMRCHFCAFYLQIYREGPARAYVSALSREIQLHAAQNTLGGRPLDSVYFGGGTPTTLHPAELSRILQSVRERFGLHTHVEITIEAHPDTVTAEGLDVLLRTGFTRISFGAQSMDAKELKRVGRPTSPDKTCTAVNLARAAGFENINLDLIYGLPGQTLAGWRSTLKETVGLNPTHLSCYALTVEDGTQLQRDVRRGKWEPDSALHLAMETEASRALGASGFHHYEISNFCRPDHACRHNLLYWTGEPYLGVGPSAQSYLHGRRFGNVDDLEAYENALEAGRMPIAQMEHLTIDQRRREAVVFGLRLTAGVDLNGLVGWAGQTDPIWTCELKRMIDEGLIEKRAGVISLTEVGRRFADSVAIALL